MILAKTLKKLDTDSKTQILITFIIEGFLYNGYPANYAK